MGSITVASFAELIFQINTDWVQNNLNCTVHCAQGHVCAYELIACVRVSLSTCHEGSAVITWRILAPAVEVVLSPDTSSKTKLTDWGGGGISVRARHFATLALSLVFSQSVSHTDGIVAILGPHIRMMAGCETFTFPLLSQQNFATLLKIMLWLHDKYSTHVTQKAPTRGKISMMKKKINKKKVLILVLI